MKVLLIDGPRAGAVYDLPNPQPTFVVPVPLEVSALDLIEHPCKPTFDTATYNIHRSAVWLWGRCINVGTVNPVKPQLEDLIEVLLSDEAKDALTP